MSEIKIITKKLSLPRTVKVAAYARVSSDKDAMLHSLSSQVSYFSKYIQSNENWFYAGVYSDEGQTGTKNKRDAFQRMIQDAMDGKIDMIITKSISRFARNTETLLKTIRELKAINVDVYFQEQNIHTISNNGELLISILASYAQEESRTCSENSLWRVRKNFSKGKIYGGNDCMGYKLVDGKFVLIPEQAAIVKKIFNLYEKGYGDMKIARLLNNEGIKAYEGGLWSKSSVRCILSNYNYTGDLILQKTYSEDYISKKRKTNNGNKDKYLVSNNHEPIITKEQFERVTNLRKERLNLNNNTSQPYKKYPFTGILKCGNCEKNYKHKKSPYKDYWICTTFEELGKAYCSSKKIRDDVLANATCQALEIHDFNEEILNTQISLIGIFNGNKLIFHFFNGMKKEIIWEEPKRSDSWTEEMREKARQNATKFNNKNTKGDNI